LRTCSRSSLSRFRIRGWPNLHVDAPTDKKYGLLALDAVVPSRTVVIRPIAQEVRRLLLAMSGRAGLLLYYRDPGYPDDVVAPGLRGLLNVVGERSREKEERMAEATTMNAGYDFTGDLIEACSCFAPCQCGVADDPNGGACWSC
jgi:hypothetical protein